MESDYIILFLVLGIFLYIIIRIKALQMWVKLNLEMKKGAGEKFRPLNPSSDLSSREARQMKLKSHRVALLRARAGRPGKKK
jgi:hypothetical protein